MISQPPRPTLFPYTTLFRSLITTSNRSAVRLDRRRGIPVLAGAVHPDLGNGCHRARPVRLAPSTRARHGRYARDRKSTRLNSSHTVISYAVFCLKKKKVN